MKSIILFFLFFVVLSNSAIAQLKDTTQLRYTQLEGYWLLDSMKVNSGMDMGEFGLGEYEVFNENFYYFSEAGKLYVGEQKQLYSVNSVEILNGAKYPYLMFLDEAQYYIIQSFSESNVVFLSYGWPDEQGVSFYLSRKKKADFSVEALLYGYYNVVARNPMERIWTIAMPNQENISLILNDSLFRFQFDGQADSGTWEVNSKDEILFSGKQNQYKSSIVGAAWKQLDLTHPLHKDSIISLTKSPVIDETQREEDSIRFADSLAAAMAMMEEQMHFASIPEIVGNWKCDNINWQFNEDGSLIYSNGKRHKKGTWKIINNYGYGYEFSLLITINKREYLMYCLLSSELLGENELRKLFITSPFPNEKKVETLGFILSSPD